MLMTAWCALSSVCLAGSIVVTAWPSMYVKVTSFPWADAGRTGDADDESRRLAAERRGGDRREQRLGLGPGRLAAALDQVQDGRGGPYVSFTQPRAQLCTVGRGGAQAGAGVSTPWRSPTSAMMSRIIAFRSQSLGV